MLLLVLASGCTAPRSDGYDVGWHFVDRLAVHSGLRSLSDNDVDSVSDQTPIGLEYDTYDPKSWLAKDRAIGFEAGIYYSEESGKEGDASVEASVLEVSLGPRMTFHYVDGRLHPYVGAGLAAVQMKAECSGSGSCDVSSDEDESLGAYLKGGVYWDLTRTLSVGVDVRALVFTDAGLGNVNTSADYLQATVAFGVAF